MPAVSARRVMFDTTVLWGAFHKPTGPNAKLLDLAAQRPPFFDGFITDAVGAEFWWRATQQGLKLPGQPVRRTYTKDELAPFLDAYEPLFEPAALATAPLSRSLGRMQAWSASRSARSCMSSPARTATRSWRDAPPTSQ